MRRFFCVLLIFAFCMQVAAEPIRWVDFDVPYACLKYAMDKDVATFEQEKHISWIDILALAACRTGGKCNLSAVKKAANDLQGEKTAQDLGGKHFAYYHEAYTAALGGLLGSYAIELDGQWKASYGLKAFSHVAAGYG